MSDDQPMKIHSRGVVYGGRVHTNRQSCAFPGICVLPGGRWICSFRAAPKKKSTSGQHALMMWSDDCGRTWSQPMRPFDPTAVAGKLGLFRGAFLTSLGGNRCVAAICWVDHSEPELPFFNEATEGLLDTKIFLSRSEDGGEHWTTPEPMDTSPFRTPVPLTGPMLRLASGEWACQFELNKPYYDRKPWRHSSVLMFSGDEGKSWNEYAITSNDPDNRLFYWDQRPAVLSDGSLLDLFWTYDNAAATYLPIHARTSRDHGRTWSPYRDIGVHGQPAAPVSLSDGTIALVYVDRAAEPAIKLRISMDGGATWPEETETVLFHSKLSRQTRPKESMRDAWSEMWSYSVGLPATARLADGSLLVVYYAGPHTDHTAIEWVRLVGRQHQDTLK